MEIIIQDCMEKIIKNSEESLINLLSQESNISEFIKDTRKTLDEIGVKIVAKALETIDSVVKLHSNRKNEWSVERRDSKTISTEFGDVTFDRTYYKNKITGEYKHLSDEIAGIQAHDRMDVGLRAKLIDSAAQLSYKKSGKIFQDRVEFTDQTVMNSIRKVEAIPNDAVKVSNPKKSVKFIYIEADEDHVANQHGNCIEPKLIYVHEGRQWVSKERFKLVNQRYFSGVYRNSEEIWLEVASYLDEAYNLDNVEQVYISGDGASWIKEGLNWISKSIYVLDRFHLCKYLKSATAHRRDLYPVMLNYIENEEKDYVKELFNELEALCESEFKKSEIRDAKRYVMNHWCAILNNFDENYHGCSAEGHVSHVLSDRLSSRPLGWSKLGVDQMSRIRAFKMNGGNLYDFMLNIKQEKIKEERCIRLDKRICKRIISSKSNNEVDNLRAIITGKTTPMLKLLKSLRGA